VYIKVESNIEVSCGSNCALSCSVIAAKRGAVLAGIVCNSAFRPYTEFKLLKAVSSEIANGNTKTSDTIFATRGRLELDTFITRPARYV
jgi:hypothetical protein